MSRLPLQKPGGKLPEETLPDARRSTGAEGPPSLRERLLRPRTLLSMALTAAMLYVVFRRGVHQFDWGEVVGYMREADPILLSLAFAVFYTSFFVRALRWRMLLANVGYSRNEGQPMPSALGLTRIMYVSWFANCVTVAHLGDVYRGYLLKRSAGVSFAVTLGTILSERILDLAVLGLMLCAATLLAFHGTLPPKASGALVVCLVLAALGVGGLACLRRFRGVLRRVAEKVLPARLHVHYGRLERGLAGSFRRVPGLVVYSVLGWLIESATLYTVAAAAGVPVPASMAVAVALISSLLSTVSIIPSGLGVAEAGMILALGWFGLDSNAATAVSLLSRLITYWSIVFLGLLAYLMEMRRPVKSYASRQQIERSF